MQTDWLQTNYKTKRIVNFNDAEQMSLSAAIAVQIKVIKNFIRNNLFNENFSMFISREVTELRRLQALQLKINSISQAFFIEL
jgi:hypothetical protein